jgi:hypothetical protein
MATLLASAVCVLAFTFVATLSGITTNNQKSKAGQLVWAPPNVDTPIPSLAATPPCSLPDVLEHVGERAKELVDNLQSFTARETIQFEELDNFGTPDNYETARFEYAVNFDQNHGRLAVQESRAPSSKTESLSHGVTDIGIAAFAVLFHPFYQGDYDMRCEGMDARNGQPAWVVHFRQAKGKRPRTLSFHTPTAAYVAKLKGRAWISADSYEILHIDTNLMEAIPMLNLKGDAVSVDYETVEFSSRNIRLRLPRTAVTFMEYDKQRYIFQHTFTNSLVGSVRTEQVIGSPQQP